MPLRVRRRGWWRAMPGLALAAVLLGALAGCSSSSTSGLNISLGLAGSTVDHPAPPPVLAAGGPGGTFAFVYNNQIWIHRPGASSAQQLTHLVLSNGSTIVWGPLVWSPGGRYIAFALVQNPTPGAPGRTAGPLYYVDTSNGNTSTAGGTGSIYGHTYAWYGENMLFFVDGGGVQMFGPLDGDARDWRVVTPFTSPDGVNFDSQGTVYGDISIVGGNLYFSQIQLATLGATGAVGSATLQEIALGFSASDTQPSDIVNFLPLNANNAVQIADLGTAYADPTGTTVTGAWQVSADGSTLVRQHVERVNPQAGTVTSAFCVRTSFGTYPGSFSGCAPVLASVGPQPLAVHPQLSLTNDGGRVAFTGDALYEQSTGGGSVAKLDDAGWVTPPAWSPDGKVVAVTQVAHQSTGSGGVVTDQTNVLVFDGKNAMSFISGGASLSWRP
jgi:hypothetical protein